MTTPDEESVPPSASAVVTFTQTLIVGRRYCVDLPFIDADGDVHERGEEWMYRGCWFNKFEDLVTVFVTDSHSSRFKIPLKWDAKAQADVIEQPSRFFVEK
jgi:hypothetical protein